MTHTYGGFNFGDAVTYCVEMMDPYSPAPRGELLSARATRAGGIVTLAPPGTRLMPFKVDIYGDGAAAIETNKDALLKAFGKRRQRLVSGFLDGRFAIASLYGQPKITYTDAVMMALDVQFVTEDAYMRAATPSADVRTPTLTLLTGTGTAYGSLYSLTPGGSAPAPLLWLVTNQSGGVTPALWHLSQRSQSPAVALATIAVVPARSILIADPDNGVFVADLTSMAGYWPLWDERTLVRDFSGMSRDLTPVPAALTISSTVVTDTTRAAGTAGLYDGRSNDGSVGVWKAATNICLRSNALNTAPWTDTGANVTTTENADIGPLGATDGNRIDFAAAAIDSVFQDIVVTASTQYTLSFWAKRGTLTDITYRLFDNTGGADIIAATSYYSQINSTTYTRVQVSFTTPVGCISLRAIVARSPSLIGNVYIWGVQLEAGGTNAGNFATPYIPTTAATATRTPAGSVSGPNTLLSAVQGGAVLRLRTGYTAANGPTGATHWEWTASANDQLCIDTNGSNFRTVIRAGGGSADIVQQTPTPALAIGNIYTAIGQWSASLVGISTNGAAFTTTARTSGLPAVSGVTRNFGTTRNGNNPGNADYLYCAEYLGQLTNAEAASLHTLLQTSEPTLDALRAAYPSANFANVFTFSDEYGDLIGVRYRQDDGGGAPLDLSPVMSFDGASGYLTSSSVGLDPTGTYMAFGAWVKADALGTARAILSKAGAAAGYSLSMNAAGMFDAAVGNTGTARATGSRAITAGQWYLVVAVVAPYPPNLTVLNLYVNAELEDQDFLSGFTLGASANAFKLGGGDYVVGSGSAFWDGSIAYPFVYQTYLTPAQVRALYTKMLPQAIGSAQAFVGQFPELDPRTGTTNLVQVRADHGTTAPTPRVGVAYRSRYE